MITSPFLVVPVIAVVFLACILWATGGTADGKTEDIDTEHTDSWFSLRAPSFLAVSHRAFRASFRTSLKLRKGPLRRCAAALVICIVP